MKDLKNKVLTLELPVPTSINALYVPQYSFNPKTRKYVPTGRIILSDEGRLMKNKIQAQAMLQAKEQGWNIEDLGEQYVYQEATIFFKRRGSDDNNIYKLLNDCLQGVAYQNDSRVLTRTERIYYSSHNPRVIVKVRLVDYIGFFNSEEELLGFEDNCRSCSSYRNGSCSVLKDLKIGNENQNYSFSDKKCLKYKAKK